MERGIYERQTGTGHRGLREEWGDDEKEKEKEKEKGVEVELGLLTLWVLCYQGWEVAEEIQQGMLQRMPCFSLLIVRTMSPTSEDWGFLL